MTTSARTLLLFFSRAGENYWEGGRRDLEVGSTKKLAQTIAERIPCDVHEIIPADPYPQDYAPTVDRHVREEADGARPTVRESLPDTARYDAVFLGSPVWDSQAPMIMYTVTETMDFVGKTVLPFVTYAVSGMSGIDGFYRHRLPDADVRTGLAVRGEDVEDSAEAIGKWLRRNGLLQGR